MVRLEGKISFSGYQYSFCCGKIGLQIVSNSINYSLLLPVSFYKVKIKSGHLTGIFNQGESLDSEYDNVRKIFTFQLCLCHCFWVCQSLPSYILGIYFF